jgi:SAM-dependent methyltransferase
MKENNLDDVSYNQFFSLCEKAYNRYGDILDLPVGVHPYDYIKQEIERRGKEQVNVLDFGCGAKTPLKQWCELSDQQYSTCDDDPGGSFTYTAVSDIPEDQQFDVISSSHVFEHLPFEVGISIGSQLASHLKPGGVFIIAVPNPKHPTRYLSSPVHVTPWNYLNLYALHEMAGLDGFHCARYNKFPRPPFYIRPLINMMCRYFMMDWADSIYVVGRKES